MLDILEVTELGSPAPGTWELRLTFRTTVHECLRKPLSRAVAHPGPYSS